jgi:hypothetical protein
VDDGADRLSRLPLFGVAAGWSRDGRGMTSLTLPETLNNYALTSAFGEWR